jgi:coproporphyrinogen III oxidase
MIPSTLPKQNAFWYKRHFALAPRFDAFYDSCRFHQIAKRFRRAFRRTPVEQFGAGANRFFKMKTPPKRRGLAFMPAT